MVQLGRAGDTHLWAPDTSVRTCVGVTPVSSQTPPVADEGSEAQRGVPPSRGGGAEAHSDRNLHLSAFGL